MKPTLQPGYQIKIRCPSGKLRHCDVQSVHETFVVLRPQHTSNTYILKEEDQILDVWDAAGNVLEVAA